MPATGSTSQLHALKALLDTAQQLTEGLLADGAIGRALRALGKLPPEDRDVITQALERAVTWHRLNESTTEVTRIRLRANPRPRLFVRIVDPDASPAEEAAQDEEEMLPAALRFMRRVRLLELPAAEAIWKPVVTRAFGMLSAAERSACLRFGRAALDLVTLAAAEAEAAADDGAGATATVGVVQRDER